MTFRAVPCLPPSITVGAVLMSSVTKNRDSGKAKNMLIEVKILDTSRTTRY